MEFFTKPLTTPPRWKKYKTKKWSTHHERNSVWYGSSVICQMASLEIFEQPFKPWSKGRWVPNPKIERYKCSLGKCSVLIPCFIFFVENYPELFFCLFLTFLKIYHFFLNGLDICARIILSLKGLIFVAREIIAKNITYILIKHFTWIGVSLLRL